MEDGPVFAWGCVEPSLVQKGIGSKTCFTDCLHITLKYELTYHALVFQGDKILNYACLIFKFQSWCSNLCQLDIHLKHFRHKLVGKIRCVSCKEVSLTWPAAKWNKKKCWFGMPTQQSLFWYGTGK